MSPVQDDLFGLLPPSRPPWKEFFFSTVTQGLAAAALLWIGVMRPQILTPPVHDYQAITLVSTPPPVNHEPAPVREFKLPPSVARLEAPIPENLRLPAPTPKPKVEESVPEPQVTMTAKKPDLPAAKPAIPRHLVQTNVFSTGSSATPTLAAAPQKVQTGGFGDPNGVPAQPNNTGKPATIAAAGSFDLPAGPGYGNGTGGAKGVRGVVASAGFGNGVATGDGSGRVNTSRGNGVVRQAGFGDSDPAAAPQARPKAAQAETPRIVPAEILSKPTPLYTPEARQLRIEGEVLLEVVFEATGHIRVLRVVRGLGHGLDESAMQAAERISFKPALRDGQPTDSTAVLHIIFQLA